MCRHQLRFGIVQLRLGRVHCALRGALAKLARLSVHQICLGRTHLFALCANRGLLGSQVGRPMIKILFGRNPLRGKSLCPLKIVPHPFKLRLGLRKLGFGD